MCCGREILVQVKDKKSEWVIQMNRTDRMLAILLELQRGGNFRKRDLQTAAAAAVLRNAILEGRTVSFSYQKQGCGEETKSIRRQVDPYGLVIISGIWYLVAFCRLRGSIRHFRLDRMARLQLEAELFERPADFDLHAYEPQDDRNVSVRVLFDHSVSESLIETRYFYLDHCEMTEAGLLAVLRVRQPEEVLSWLLGWGSKARVLEPASLRVKIQQEARAMLQK